MSDNRLGPTHDYKPVGGARLLSGGRSAVVPKLVILLTGFLLLVAAFLTSASAIAGTAQPSQIREGLSIATQECSGCHAIGLTDASTNLAAPPLRDLYKRYAVDALREEFLKGYQVAHPPMPRFQLPQAKVGPLLAFLKSLNPCSAPSTDQAAMERCFEPL